jgi:hypothetical protein
VNATGIIGDPIGCYSRKRRRAAWESRTSSQPSFSAITVIGVVEFLHLPVRKLRVAGDAPAFIETRALFPG